MWVRTLTGTDCQNNVENDSNNPFYAYSASGRVVVSNIFIKDLPRPFQFISRNFSRQMMLSEGSLFLHKQLFGYSKGLSLSLSSTLPGKASCFL